MAVTLLSIENKSLAHVSATLSVVIGLDLLIPYSYMYGDYALLLAAFVNMLAIRALSFIKAYVAICIAGLLTISIFIYAVGIIGVLYHIETYIILTESAIYWVRILELAAIILFNRRMYGFIGGCAKNSRDNANSRLLLLVNKANSGDDI